MRILISAYACRPNAGSEEGVGWGAAASLSLRHKVVVVTWVGNRAAIESHTSEVPGVCFVYLDVPFGPQLRRLSLQLHYFVWQFCCAPAVLNVVSRATERFDVAHHVSYVRYWSPSVLRFLESIPIVIGPVGGGENTPLSHLLRLSFREFIHWIARRTVKGISRLLPAVRKTGSSASLIVVTTPESYRAVSTMTARFASKVPIAMGSEAALSNSELRDVFQFTRGGGNDYFASTGPAKFLLCAGRLLGWKGYSLAIEAFSRIEPSRRPSGGLHIVGDGPERARLQRRARGLGVEHEVHFHGSIPRRDLIRLMGEASAFVHPSYQDSGGWVCLEAMAMRCPVICLDRGGPATQVVDGVTGNVIVLQSFERTVHALASAMERLVHDEAYREELGRNAFAHVKANFLWDARVERYEDWYRIALENWLSQR